MSTGPRKPWVNGRLILFCVMSCLVWASTSLAVPMHALAPPRIDDATRFQMVLRAFGMLMIDILPSKDMREAQSDERIVSAARETLKRLQVPDNFLADVLPDTLFVQDRIVYVAIRKKSDIEYFAFSLSAEPMSQEDRVKIVAVDNSGKIFITAQPIPFEQNVLHALRTGDYLTRSERPHFNFSADLRKMLASKDPYVRATLVLVVKNPTFPVMKREVALWALGTLGNPRATEVIAEALKDEAPDMVASAAAILKKAAIFRGWRDPRIVEPLIASLETARPKVKEAQAVMKTTRMNSSRYQDSFLIREIVVLIAEALGSYKDRRAVGPLRRLLRDSSDLEAKAAIRALGAIGDPVAIEDFLDYLHTDKDRGPGDWVSEANVVEEAILNIGDASKDYLHRWTEKMESKSKGKDWGRRRILLMLVKLGDAEAVGKIIAGNEGEPEWMTREVISALTTYHKQFGEDLRIHAWLQKKYLQLYRKLSWKERTRRFFGKTPEDPFEMLIRKTLVEIGDTHFLVTHEGVTQGDLDIFLRKHLMLDGSL